MTLDFFLGYITKFLHWLHKILLGGLAKSKTQKAIYFSPNKTTNATYPVKHTNKKKALSLLSKLIERKPNDTNSQLRDIRPHDFFSLNSTRH